MPDSLTPERLDELEHWLQTNRPILPEHVSPLLRLAREHFALLDPTPITEDWLREVGWRIIATANRHGRQWEANREELELNHRGNLTVHSGEDSLAWPVPITTRGDLRMLLAALRWRDAKG